MMILALDTATKWGRFALADGDDVLVYRPLNVSGSYADALLPVVEEMLAEAGRPRSDLSGIAVTIGPGSFTGVRIGVATAKGLAWALGVPLAGVTTLAAMAAALLREYPATELAAPVLDARRGEVFAGIFAREGTWVTPVVPPAAGEPDAWWARIMAEDFDPEAPVYGGDGTGLLLGQGQGLRPELRGLGAPRRRLWTSAHPATAPAMAVAMGRGALPEEHPFTLVPAYMRVSDAEIKRRVDLTPTEPGSDITSHRTGRRES